MDGRSSLSRSVEKTRTRTASEADVRFMHVDRMGRRDMAQASGGFCYDIMRDVGQHRRFCSFDPRLPAMATPVTTCGGGSGLAVFGHGVPSTTTSQG